MGNEILKHDGVAVEIVDDPAIELRGVRAGYGENEVLHGLELKLQPGTWTVLLGPNGSGKTTLLKTLMGQIEPFEGDAYLKGLQCFSQRLPLKRIVGYLPEEMYLYPELTGEQQLRFAGDMYEIPLKTLRERIDLFLTRFNMQEHRNRPIKNYSLGMKRKIGLGVSLLHFPEILLLDEPMNGLDPESADITRSMLKAYCQERNLTILMSTHNMGMLHQYCDEILIFSQGRILVRNSPGRLRSKYPELTLEEIFLETVKKVTMDDK